MRIMTKRLRNTAFTLTAAAILLASNSSCLGAPSEHTMSEEVAVVTEQPPAAVEVTDWNIAVQTDLPNNRLKIKAICALENRGSAPADVLDCDLLGAESFYGVEVEIAEIAKLTGDTEMRVKFKRFIVQEPKDPSQARTREFPEVTRVFLSPPLKAGEKCRLAFVYTITCVDIKERQHYNLIWEPEEGMKETCLMGDFAWYPRFLSDDTRKSGEIESPWGQRNFFSRGSNSMWRVTLTHPVGLEGVVIEGRLKKSERAGEQVVSEWTAIVGGGPQIFIGPAERLEKKREGLTVVFFLPKGKYNPEFVEAVADLVTHAYSVYTGWFGPLERDEFRIVATSGIGGGHGAFMGMTSEPSYFQMKKSERMTESGKFFSQMPVHELAHSWWGHSVISYGRGTKFLRESLAEFSTWHLARQYYGTDFFKVGLQRLIEQGQADRPLFDAAKDKEQFAYEKGPIVLDVLRQEMGDEVFFRTLKEYARRYKNAHTTFIDFVLVCNEVSRRDWLPFFYQWCYGKGCPAYHLVGFESKEGKDGWETEVKIRNDGQGIVRCPLELRMEGASRGEVFWVPGGEERTFAYRTKGKVTDAVIDPKGTAYQADLAARRKDPVYLVTSLGSGRKSNQEIASKYTREWLDQISNPGLLFKTGLALYDVKRYAEALAVFEKMGEKAQRRTDPAIALIWQGHVLDLLGKRDEAVLRYKKVVDMDTKQEIQIHHDQFGLEYYPSPYARERIDTPFTRLENLSDD